MDLQTSTTCFVNKNIRKRTILDFFFSSFSLLFFNHFVFPFIKFVVNGGDWNVIQTNYFVVETDRVDETRVVNGAADVQLQIASNIRTMTLWARVTIRPRLKPVMKDKPEMMETKGNQ